MGQGFLPRSVRCGKSPCCLGIGASSRLPRHGGRVWTALEVWPRRKPRRRRGFRAAAVARVLPQIVAPQGVGELYATAEGSARTGTAAKDHARTLGAAA